MVHFIFWWLLHWMRNYAILSSVPCLVSRVWTADKGCGLTTVFTTDTGAAFTSHLIYSCRSSLFSFKAIFKQIHNKVVIFVLLLSQFMPFFSFLIFFPFFFFFFFSAVRDRGSRRLHAHLKEPGLWLRRPKELYKAWGQRPYIPLFSDLDVNSV